LFQVRIIIAPALKKETPKLQYVFLFFFDNRRQ